MSDKLDIIIVGATGYTGKITARFLHSLGTSAGKWGIAGRSIEKLNKLKEELKQDVPTFVVDITKPETLDAVCQKAEVIISCAGPFTNIGMPVVEACVRNSTHYVDSTGEFNFVRQVIERFHDEATKKGIVLVSCCGFDSVPADVGNYVLHKEAGEPVKSVRCYYDTVNAGFSNGTAQSLGAIFGNMSKEDSSPTSLVPRDTKTPLAPGHSRMGLWYSFKERRWSAPFLMAPTNERVVQRSNALRGVTASYVEAMEGGFFTMLRAWLSTYVLAAITMFGPVRRFLIDKFFPADGTTGPLDSAKSASYFKCTFLAETTSGKEVTTILSSKQEMYNITGVFLGECALSAVALSKSKKIKPGVLTPSTAFGDELVRRCIANRIEINTTVVDSKNKKVQ